MFGACRATLHTDFREIELASEQKSEWDEAARKKETERESE